jgi:alpha-galactosidase
MTNNSCDFSKYSTDASRHLGNVVRALSYLFLVCGFVFVTGCKKSEAPVAANKSEVAKSTIEVTNSADGITVRTSTATFLLRPSGQLTSTLQKNGATVSLDGKTPDSAQAISIGKKEFSGVLLDTTRAQIRDAGGKLGPVGKQIEVTGKIPGTDLQETATLDVYDAFPNLAMLSIRLQNLGQTNIAVDSVTLQRHTFASAGNPGAPNEPLWSFEGSSLKWGKDEIFPVPAKFSQENPFGEPVAVKDDLGHVGGGIPVIAFWSRTVGEAIGHVETLPLALSIPVQTTTDGRVEAAVRIPAKTILKPNETYSTPRTFLAIYSGDFYEPLKLWSDVIEKEGLSKPLNNDENYAVSWCGWGYEFAVTPKQMLDTVPKLKELGIHWATLDDGWFNNYGDWQPNNKNFPGDAIQDMVRKFHEQGIKVQLWWLPLAAEDGKFGYGGRKFILSDVVKEHPDWLILDKDGKPARMARNIATLCPAVPEVREYYKQLTTRFIRDWDFDGHKLDNIYSTPLCYNPKHHHKSPYDSVNAMGDVYKTIFETTRALKADSVTQSCPCGTPPSIAWLRYMDQAVTADPVGSIQVRRRIKMYKALLGPRAAIYGDHVELTRVSNTFTNDEQDVGEDFSSTLGTGGVLGTKFTWPDYGPKFKNVQLTPEKEAHWKEWIGLYNQKLLSKGNFLNLYTYGFDVPEAYAIEKDGHYYYAFYAPEKPREEKKDVSKHDAPPPAHSNWSGDVELRGLPAGTFRVTDYVHHKDYGTVTGPTAHLKVDFTDSLLLEVVPAP